MKNGVLKQPPPFLLDIYTYIYISNVYIYNVVYLCIYIYICIFIVYIYTCFGW